jgi:hypothetical protein
MKRAYVFTHGLLKQPLSARCYTLRATCPGHVAVLLRVDSVCLRSEVELQKKSVKVNESETVIRYAHLMSHYVIG